MDTPTKTLHVAPAVGMETPTKTLHVAPANSAKVTGNGEPEERSASQIETVFEEEASVWAGYGVPGFRPGADGALPDGFHFDADGNIVVCLLLFLKYQLLLIYY